MHKLETSTHKRELVRAMNFMHSTEKINIPYESIKLLHTLLHDVSFIWSSKMKNLFEQKKLPTKKMPK